MSKAEEAAPSTAAPQPPTTPRAELEQQAAELQESAIRGVRRPAPS